VVEAWAAGCGLIVNSQVGALFYLDGEHERLMTAADDFWALALGKVAA
jgi:hypothetical protein